MATATELEDTARRVRRAVVEMCHRAQSSHVGSGLSVADLLSYVFSNELDGRRGAPDNHDTDMFIMSKGHAAAALYSILHLAGSLTAEALDTFCADGSPLIGHVNHRVSGVDVSTGSLGHGLGIGLGVALARREHRGSGRVFVLLGDGECDEGSIWEAALFAGHLALDNLIAIVDYNRLQGLGPPEAIVGLEPFVAKWESFRWVVTECDGHDFADIAKSFSRRHEHAPLCIVARTVKGKGVSFMEEAVLWHYRAPNREDRDAAINELGVEDATPQ